MAGFLPNVPGVRVPFHRDGTLVKIVPITGGAAWTTTGLWTTIPSTDVTEMNDGDYTGFMVWSVTGTGGKGAVVALVFPQPITLVGHNIMYSSSNAAVDFAYSTDTIDGTDGTWTTETTVNESGSLTPDEWRSITAVNLPGIKGIRLLSYSTNPYGDPQSFTLRDFQLYAQWSPATLAAWHPTLDQQVDGYHLDFGDVLLGQIHTKQFRIKNGRALTANNTVVSCTTGTAEFISGLSFSLDGSTFTSTVTIPTIAPGAISPIVHVRRTVGAGQAANIVAMAPIDFVATTWT